MSGETKKNLNVFLTLGGGKIGPKSRFLKKKLLQILSVYVSASLRSCKMLILWIVNILTKVSKNKLSCFMSTHGVRKLSSKSAYFPG